MIEAALAECNGRVSGPRGAAARGLPQSTLDSKIKTPKSTNTVSEGPSPGVVGPACSNILHQIK